MKNSKQHGAATVFVYPNKEKYIGVCLELDLIDEDRNKEVLVDRMKQRIQSYVCYVHKKDHDDTLLNRPAPKKYWDKFYQFLELMHAEEKKRMRSTASLKPFVVTSRASDFVVSRENFACEPA